MLIGRLAAGAVDVVGDVHGELEVLDALITHLGYDGEGRHREGRRLVFVGDLVDRGRDSLAVVRRVRSLVHSGRAQCVLGNHELNILRNERKDGNDWFHDDITEDERKEVCAFFATLPLVLERDDLRVVHACWDDGHVSSLRGRTGSVVELSEQLAADIERLADEGILVQARRESEHPLHDRDRRPPMLRARLRLWQGVPTVGGSRST